MVRIFLCSLFAALALAGPSGAQQDYPNRPIRLVAPFAAGATLDITARIVGEQLAEVFGKQVIVENKPGASGLLGSGVVAKAPPDGYTLLLFTPSSMFSSISLYTQMPFDPTKDLVPVAKIGNTDFVLISGNDLPVKTLQEFVALAKASPSKYTLGYKSLTAQLTVEWLKQAAGIDVRSIPYRDGAAAFVDLASGQLSAMVEPVPSSIGQIKAGRVKAIAVSASQRSAALPDVPTVIESGYAGIDTSVEAVVYAPAGTPAPIIARLHQEISRIVQIEAVRAKLAQVGMDAMTKTPQALTEEGKDAPAKWGRIIKLANIPKVN
ncbi:MAG: tripartite tricarboxylate transporter substrate binding protein [Burkholderiales bacterium]|nr:tripartite tricarboxylate transporter substrate binding protein [Burkholderiales bacterium]